MQKAPSQWKVFDFDCGRRGSSLEWCCTSCCPVLYDELRLTGYAEKKCSLEWWGWGVCREFWGNKCRLTSSEVIIRWSVHDDFTILRIEWFLIHPSIITKVKRVQFSNQDITGEDEWSRQLKWTDATRQAAKFVCLETCVPTACHPKVLRA